MTTMTCDQLQEVAAELALDLLDGVERAAALAHLEHCTVVPSRGRLADRDRRAAPPPRPGHRTVAGVRRRRRGAGPTTRTWDPASATAPRGGRRRDAPTAVGTRRGSRRLLRR